MRATALIRKILLLELLQQQASQQMRTLRQQLKQKEISIIERNVRPVDIEIQYRCKERLYQAVFMRPMLDAEVEGLMKKWRDDSPK